MIEFPEAMFERVGNVTMVLNMPRASAGLNGRLFFKMSIFLGSHSSVS
jgi:hypothetical protein